MKTIEKIEQAKTCLQLLNNHPEHIYSKHHAPQLQQTLNEVNASIALVTATEARWKKERAESNAALEKVIEKALYYGNILKIELSHMEVVSSLQEPRNMIEKAAYVDAVIELTSDNEQDLYFAKEALELLLPLEAAFDRELQETIDTKEEYHRAIAIKNTAVNEMNRLVVDTKRFVRQAFGLKSRQYQAIKDNIFSKPAPQKRTPQDPSNSTENPPS